MRIVVDKYPVPTFLARAVESNELARRGGELHLEIPKNAVGQLLHMWIVDFVTAFPWLYVEWLRAAGPDGDRTTKKFWLIVCLNLFTDQIYLYCGSGSGTFDRALMSFVPTARKNRACMREPLKRWEGEIGGRITHGKSEIVDGVEHYGFADAAWPL